jgi:hypothetical protein
VPAKEVNVQAGRTRQALPALPTAAAAAPAEADVQFTGYSEEQMHTIGEMSAQLRRNEYLNILEGIVATGIIASGGMDFGLESTERLLYITCCLSNAYCLRYAMHLHCNAQRVP